VADLYVPPDSDEAIAAWGANCGPHAIAAVLGVPLATVHPAVSKPPKGAPSLPGLEPDPAFPRYMGIGDLRAATEKLGARIGAVRRPFSFEPSNDTSAASRRDPDWQPSPWLVMVNWLGPWTGTRGEAAYRHVVAYREGYFDVSQALGHGLAFHGSALEILAEWASMGIGVRGAKAGPAWIYDCNVGWLPAALWEAEIPKRLMPARSSGWRCTWGGQVLR
jgi:hypothetical protein